MQVMWGNTILRFRGWLLLVVFAAAGGLILTAADSRRFIPSDSQIYNLIWLDAWVLLSVAALFLLWHYSVRRGQRRTVILWCIGLCSLVALSIIFLRASFPDNGYWGDQKFRIAMVQRFMTSLVPADYYFKNLPAFYPPSYYYLLAFIGKLGGHPAYETIQIGFRLLSLALPFALFALWRKVVSPTCALFVACAVMFVDIGGSYMIVNVPHAFLGNSLFVPWWLHYIEGVGVQETGSRRRWLVGSLLGAFIFTTYFYPFFLLAFWLLVRLMGSAVRVKTVAMPLRALKWIGAILGGAALFSAPYWLPVFNSIAKYGMDRSRGDWHHAGSPGLNFPFMELNPVGVMMLIAIGVVLWRTRRRVNQLMTLMLGTIFAYFLIGSVLGALDHPVNLIKTREFSWAICGPIIGLAGYTVYSWARSRPRRQFLAYGVAVVCLVTLVRGFSTVAQDSTVERARQTGVPDYGIAAEDADRMSSAVILSYNEEFFAFYPAHTFLCINEHYAHPASRFAQRYDFIRLLQHVKNPSVLHLALRHNVFDTVDYIMAEHKGDGFYFGTALSTYPDKLHLVETKLDDSLFRDSTLFRQRPGPNLFQVTSDDTFKSPGIDCAAPRDTVTSLHRLALLAARSDSTARAAMRRILGEAFVSTEDCMAGNLVFWITPRLALIGCTATPQGDSVHITATFRVNRSLLKPQRLFLHVYGDSRPDELQNVEFPPNFDTRSWSIGELVTVDRCVARAKGPFGFVLGFFDDDGQYGDSFTGHFYAGNRPAGL